MHRNRRKDRGFRIYKETPIGHSAKVVATLRVGVPRIPARLPFPLTVFSPRTFPRLSPRGAWRLLWGALQFGPQLLRFFEAGPEARRFGELLEGGLWRGLADILTGIGDLERILARVALKTARPRDLATLRDGLGLLPTLLWHFERYSSRTNVEVAFKHTGLEGRFAPEVETAAYRIVQEALTNVVRHAGVGEVTVRLWAKQDTLGVQIEDQGIGFAPEAALATGATSGLAGMRERAILLGGRLTIESAAGTGTRVTAEFPLGDRLLERREMER